MINFLSKIKSLGFSLKKIKNPSPLKFLTIFLMALALIGFLFSLIAFLSAGFEDNFFSSDICFENSCTSIFMDEFNNSFLIAKATLDVLVSIATIGGIIVALMSYLTSAGTAALTNHIAHFSIFHNYVSTEVLKRNRVSPESIDILVWYNFIFSTSRNGKTDISQKYVYFINETNELIKRSNAQAEHAIDGSFRYKQHQERIKTQLKKSGIDISSLPRNDFFEIEGHLFSLLNRVNQSFCYSDSIPELIERKYI